jgi:hypothetical protein
MADGLLSNESPLEFFKAQVEGAMERQHLKTSVWTSYYIVQMLAGYVARRDNSALGLPGLDDEPLGLRLVRALQAEGAAQREELRSIGDASLFLVGFFADSLQRRLADIDYYISLGGSAYGRLAQSEDDAFSDVFGEMANKFVPLTDVLADVSERARLNRNRDVLRIYERWLRNRSRRDGEWLAERGIVPNRSATHRLQ